MWKNEGGYMKKLSVLCLVVVLVLSVATLAFAQAKAEPKAAPAPIGGAIVDVVKITATVEKVDYATRMVTLKGPKGNTLTFKASDAVKNLDQVKVGDKVNAQYLESVAVFVRKSGEPPMAGEMDAVGVAPKGAKPGVVMVQTDQVTAKVKAVDVKKRTLTLTGPEGQTKTFKVDPSVKRLNEIKKGDEIVLRVTQALAIEVVKP
jgi:Cu/Ag efflux protein CusF